jgi:phosphoadenylyl-sulfate reductase (thioredoxin)
MTSNSEHTNSISKSNQDLEDYVQNLDWHSMNAENLLRWAFDEFGSRAVLATSFQRSGMAMFHMAYSGGIPLRIATIDTLRLHDETYSFIDHVEAHYSTKIERWQPKSSHVERMVGRFGEYLFFDSKEKQEHCCDVRKTKPRNSMLSGMDCWISGLRWEQSDYRRQTAKKVSLISEYGTQRKLLKLNPLIDWNDLRLDDYVRANDVPEHPLYAQGFPSFGCKVCATPIRPGEDKRAGRWRWFNGMETTSDDKECGLHYTI